MPNDLPAARAAELDATWDRVGTVALRMAQQGGAPGDQFLEDLLVLREAFDALTAAQARAAPVLVAAEALVHAYGPGEYEAVFDDLIAAVAAWRAAREE